MPFQAPPKPGKSFNFTLNNWSNSELDTIMGWGPDLITVVGFGRETGPENGVRHLQGFVVFRDTHRISALKKLLPRASWSNTRCQAATEIYCKKGGNYTVRDFRYGRRGDATSVTELVPSGRNSRPSDLRFSPDRFLESYFPNLRIGNLFRE